MGAINWDKSSTFKTNAEQKITDFMNNKVIDQLPVGDWRDYITALGFVEGNNSYNSKNGSYYGIYQIGKAVLTDVKYFNKNGSNVYTNINNMTDFKMLPYAQDDAVLREMSGLNSGTVSKYRQVKNALELASKEPIPGDPGNYKYWNLDDFLGQTITFKFNNNIPQEVTITQAGISAAAHLLGAGAMASLMKKGIEGTTINDAEAGGDGSGTAFTVYMELFKSYDISTLINATNSDYATLRSSLWNAHQQNINAYFMQTGRPDLVRQPGVGSRLDVEVLGFEQEPIANSEAERLTEKMIPLSSTEYDPLTDDTAAIQQAYENSNARMMVNEAFSQVCEANQSTSIVDVKVGIDLSVTVTFADGKSCTVNRDNPFDYTVTQVTVPSGPATNLFNLTNTMPTDTTQQGASDQEAINNQLDQNILYDDGITRIVSNVGADVNTNTGAAAIANYDQSGNYRPGNNNTGNQSTLADYVTNYSLYDDLMSAAQANTASTWLTNTLAPTDPLVLDLNGDGVKLTDYGNDGVLFDADHDGGSLEQTGWASPEDGIVVMDVNNNGRIDDISETLSEYFGGTVGTGGSAGTKPYRDGFAALKSLDSNADNVFNSADAQWNNVKVWVDANHDGKSWIDTNGNGVFDGGDATELKTLAQLGITQINLNAANQSGLMSNGNEVLATGTIERLAA